MRVKNDPYFSLRCMSIKNIRFFFASTIFYYLGCHEYCANNITRFLQLVSYLSRYTVQRGIYMMKFTSDMKYCLIVISFFRLFFQNRGKHMFHRGCIPFDVRNAWKHNRLVIDESRPKQSCCFCPDWSIKRFQIFAMKNGIHLGKPIVRYIWMIAING